MKSELELIKGSSQYGVREYATGYLRADFREKCLVTW